MHVGALKARMLVREARTLKDKRQVIRSIIDRMKAGFNVSVTEVDAHDDHRLAVLGVAAVAAESATVQHVLQQIAEALRRHPIAECLGVEIEELL